LRGVDRFPKKPGVYLMKDRQGRILYVGKAKELQSRLRQYFSSQDERIMIPFLVAKVQEVETIVVQNEKEALLLENTLIKEHQPPYNVLLKDDKTYLALKINQDHAWPMCSMVRVKGHFKKKELYFGPYTSANSARETLDEIHKLFLLRQCSDRELKSRKRPCILYQMGRCMAPCIEKCTSEEYQKEVEKAIQFLKGETKFVLNRLWKELNYASDALEYEKANFYLKKIRSIEKTLEKQKVNLIFGKNFDVWGLYREGDRGELSLLTYQSGKLMGVTYFPFSKSVQESKTLLESALIQYYSMKEESPKEIVVPLSLSKELKEVIGTTITCPKKGNKRSLIEMAEENALVQFQRKVNHDQLLVQLQERLKLGNFPHKIECIDTSNLSGISSPPK